MKNKLFAQKMPWWKRALVVIFTISLVVISYAGYAIYNKQNEEKNRLLREISSLKGESEEFKSEIKKLNSELEKTRTAVDTLSKQNEKASQVIAAQDKQITEQDTQINKEEVCRQANDLLLEIKEACDIKPFPGINECIEETEGKLEYLGEENYKKYHLDDKVDNLKELKSRYLPLKNQCEE